MSAKSLFNKHEYDTLSQRVHQETVSVEFDQLSLTLGNRTILQSVSGVAEAGQILAVLGPSGAGKTMLLNALTGVIQPTCGHVTLNGQPLDRRWRRKMAYVMQKDAFYASLTLRETLTYSALLRLPGRMPYDLKTARISELVDVLQLNSCLDTKMGDAFMTGLSGGERKRAYIASELLTSPQLLILDEPTSGLDSEIAYSLMSTLDNYARLSQKTVITTIHQPSSQIFHMFNKLLLLVNGQVAYFGCSDKVVEHFASFGMHCAPHYNPADFIIEKVKSGEENVRKLVQAATSCTQSKRLRCADESHPSDSDCVRHTQTTSDVQSQSTPADHSLPQYGTFISSTSEPETSPPAASALRRVEVDRYVDAEAEWQTGLWLQYSTLTSRNFRRHRARYFSRLLYGQKIFIALMTGLVWFRMERTEDTARDRLGMLQVVIVMIGLLKAIMALTALADDEGVVRRERMAGIYRLSAYFLAVMTTEIPVVIVITTMFVTVSYWMAGLTPAAGNFLGHWLVVLMFAFACQGVGLLFSVVVTDKALATTLCSSFMIASLMADGFLNTHMSPLLCWLQYISMFTYSLSAVAIIEFEYGSPLRCNSSATLFPTVCTGRDSSLPGELLLQSWHLDFTTLSVDCLVIVSIIIISRCATYVILRLTSPHARALS